MKTNSRLAAGGHDQGDNALDRTATIAVMRQQAHWALDLQLDYLEALETGVCMDLLAEAANDLPGLVLVELGAWQKRIDHQLSLAA